MVQDGMILLFLGFVVELIAILKPIIKLNNTITKLNTSFSAFEQRYMENHKDMKARINVHDTNIAEIKSIAIDNRARIINLEKGQRHGKNETK